MTAATMEGPGILGALATHPFLKGIDDRLLTLLISGAHSFRFADGEIIGHAGNAANDFFLIQAGEVSIQALNEQREAQEVCRVPAGEVVGWSWVIAPYRWQFTCRAVGEVSGIRFNAQWLRSVCDEHADLGYAILRHLLAVVARRLSATRFNFHQPTFDAML